MVMTRGTVLFVERLAGMRFGRNSRCNPAATTSRAAMNQRAADTGPVKGFMARQGYIISAQAYAGLNLCRRNNIPPSPNSASSPDEPPPPLLLGRLRIGGDSQ